MSSSPSRTTSQPAPPRGLIVFLIAIFVCYLGWGLYLSITDILSFDDFEVYHYIGSVAAGRTDNIYELTTPHQQRGPFLYPPSAAVLFVPLSWLPHDVAGVLFAIVKMACLPLLWFGGVWFSGRRPIDALGMLLCMLAPAIMLHRAVASDIGNGQINMIVALAAIGGVWMSMLSKRWWWLGCVVLAWSIAIKMTPALLLGVLLLNRKWKALAMTIVLAALLLFAMPIAWFGTDGYRKMNDQYREVAARFTFDWASPHAQTTPTELFQFARLQNGDAETTAADAPDVLPVSISGYAGERLFAPEFRPPAMRFWFVTGLTVGAAYLLWRWRMLGLRDVQTQLARDWTWDVAMLCVMVVLLSPRAQKAHMVMLIVPAAWLASRICAWIAPGALPTGSKRPLLGCIAYGVICAMFLTGESLKISVGGWAEPARFLPLLAVMSLAVMIAIVGWIDAREVRRSM